MARPKLGDSETERLHIKITADEVTQIDDWRYENRVPSRSEAVRRLVQMALTFDRNRLDLIAAIQQATATTRAVNDRFAEYLSSQPPEQVERGAIPIVSAIADQTEASMQLLTTFSAAVRPINAIRDQSNEFPGALKASSETEKFFRDLSKKFKGNEKDREK